MKWIVAAWMAFFSWVVLSDAFAHSWYPPSCCGDYDCHPVQAWPVEEGKWKFRYVDGTVYDVPEGVIQPDHTNKEPFQAHACVVGGTPDSEHPPYVRCFWKSAAGT